MVVIGYNEEDLQAITESTFLNDCIPDNPMNIKVEEILEIYKKAFK